MTFQELSKQLNISVQNLQNIVQVLSAAFSEMEGSQNYSTSEHIVGKWIDNKDLYEISFYQPLNGTSGSIDISGLNADQCFITDGFYEISDGVTTLPICEYISASGYNYAHVNKGIPFPNIDLYCNIPNSKVFVTLRYTKKS